MSHPSFSRLALAQASLALLGGAATTEAEAGWLVDSAALYYKEDGGRVTAVEPVLNLQHDDGEERFTNLKIVLDTLSGASPNGAAPARIAQTFSGPSGSNASVTPAGELPVQKGFEDERVALSLSRSTPVGERTRMTLGGNYSGESDFTSLGANGALAWDLNDKNTTLSTGLNVEFDRINPTGGAPVGLSALSSGPATGGESEGEGEGGGAAASGPDETRQQIDAMLGVTQILGRHSLLQLNYGITTSSGYHTDPYKILTVLDGSYHLAAGATPGSTLYLHEQRPDSRTRQSLFAEWKYIFTEDVIDLSLRYTSDDWGVQSRTADAKYRLALGEHVYLEPHLRWYTQTAADFYRAWLQDGVEVTLTGPGTVLPLVTAASADPRLGAFDATTTGLKLGYAFDRDSELNLRVERYHQAARSPAPPATGDLAGVQLMPDFNASWITLGYSFRW